MLVMTFKCIYGLAPSYLAELAQPRKRDGRLRQNYAAKLHQGIIKKCIGDSAFGAAAPPPWNELPVRCVSSEGGIIEIGIIERKQLFMLFV